MVVCDDTYDMPVLFAKTESCLVGEGCRTGVLHSHSSSCASCQAATSNPAVLDAHHSGLQTLLVDTSKDGSVLNGSSLIDSYDMTTCHAWDGLRVSVTVSHSMEQAQPRYMYCVELEALSPMVCVSTTLGARDARYAMRK